MSDRRGPAPDRVSGRVRCGIRCPEARRPNRADVRYAATPSGAVLAPRSARVGGWLVQLPTPDSQLPTISNAQLPSELPTHTLIRLWESALSIGPWAWLGVGSWMLGVYLSPHLISRAPTVKPAPTDTISSVSPRLSRLLSTASLSARGIVAAVVLPNFSMLMTTFSSGTPSFSAADRMMRRFA